MGKEEASKLEADRQWGRGIGVGANERKDSDPPCPINFILSHVFLQLRA